VSADLRRLVATHEPATPREARACRTMLAYLGWLRAPLDEHADPVHVTGSAIVLDGDGGRTLLHHHKRLGRWLQPGGHVDPGETPAAAALREAREETGVPLDHVDGVPRLVHVDVHEGGRGHLHLDLRYALVGDRTAAFAPAPGESRQLQWVAVEEIDAWGDASVADAVRAAAGRSQPT
jgi:8-oxo-dGTP pyrophosphatase MutT (NUDIX family)